MLKYRGRYKYALFTSGLLTYFTKQIGAYLCEEKKKE